MIRFVAVVALVAAASAKAVDDQADLGVEPQYQSEDRPANIKAPAESSPLQSVQEYVQNAEIDRIAKNAAPTAFLQVASEVHASAHADVSHHDSMFMDAVLVDSLEEHMKHTQKDEKYVGPRIDTAMASPSNKHTAPVPERPPENLPEHLKAAFNKAAQKYEEKFQKHFANGLPHPASYLEQTSKLTADQSASMPHEFEYKHTVHPEPQILLPVPAHFLYNAAVSEYQRQQMLQAGLRSEQQRQGARMAQDKNASPVMMETSAKTTERHMNLGQQMQFAAPVAAANPVSANGAADFVSGFEYMTPATVTMTNGAIGQQPGLALSPATMNMASAYSTNVAGVGYGGQYGAAMGVGVAGGMMGAPSNLQPVGGVQAPAPPLRPDNLPPPPYVKPAPLPDMSAGTGAAAPAFL